jgi:hypothetical protein
MVRLLKAGHDLIVVKRAVTSDNTIFTLRAIWPSVQQKLEVNSGKLLAVAEKRNQLDTSAPPNRIAAAPLGLKVVGRREYNNVIRNLRTENQNEL